MKGFARAFFVYHWRRIPTFQTYFLFTVIFKAQAWFNPCTTAIRELWTSFQCAVASARHRSAKQRSPQWRLERFQNMSARTLLGEEWRTSSIWLQILGRVYVSALPWCARISGVVDDELYFWQSAGAKNLKTVNTNKYQVRFEIAVSNEDAEFQSAG